MGLAHYTGLAFALSSFEIDFSNTRFTDDSTFVAKTETKFRSASFLIGLSGDGDRDDGSRWMQLVELSAANGFSLLMIPGLGLESYVQSFVLVLHGFKTLIFLFDTFSSFSYDYSMDRANLLNFFNCKRMLSGF